LRVNEEKKKKRRWERLKIGTMPYGSSGSRKPMPIFYVGKKKGGPSQSPEKGKKTGWGGRRKGRGQTILDLGGVGVQPGRSVTENPHRFLKN